MNRSTQGIVETTFSLHIDIARPADEVRRHCIDIPYHATHGLHPHITYTVRSIAPRKIKFIQEIRVLGIPHRDECNMTLQPNGDICLEITSGINHGFKARFRFEELGQGLTRMHGEFTVALSGFRRWIGPLFRRAVARAAYRAMREDKADLESLNYRHHSSHG